MRAAAVLVVVLSVTALSAQSTPRGSGGATRTGDEAAVQKLIAGLSDGISAGNFKNAGALWDQDGVYFTVEGEKITGPAQIEAAMSESLSGVKVSIRTTTVHWASPDVAIVQGAWQASGSDGQGNSGLLMLVVRKAGSDWKFVEVRPWVPAQ